MVAVPLAPAGRHLSNSGQSPGYTCRLYLWSRVSEQIPTRSINGCMLNEGFCMTSSFILSCHPMLGLGEEAEDHILGSWRRDVFSASPW